MGLYVGDKAKVEQSFEEFEEGSASILNSNPWYRGRVTVVDQVQQFEKFFGFNNSVRKPQRMKRSISK